MALTRLVGEKLVEEYVKLLKDGHKENCLWRNRSCDGIFISLSVFSNHLFSDSLQIPFNTCR